LRLRDCQLLPFTGSRVDFCSRLYTHTCIPEAHACSSRRHMAVLQQVAVKTSCVFVRVCTCVRSFVRRSFARSLCTSALASGYRLYMRCDVHCSGVAYEGVLCTSFHRFPIRKFYSCRDEREILLRIFIVRTRSLKILQI